MLFFSIVVRGALSGRAYAELIVRRGVSEMRFWAIACAVMAAGLWLLSGLIAQKYFADKPLLKGAHIVGEVLEFDARPQTRGRSGKKLEYVTAVTYTFTTPDARRFTSFTRRTLNSPPKLHRGGPIDVLYEPDNPGHSTMGSEFELDMGEMSFGAWFLLLWGSLLALHAYRYVQWQRAVPR
jgi:hypothetical protein